MTEPLNPLTPADCDLRGMPWMPFDVQHLRESVLDPEVFCAVIVLRAAAWHQVPAASLPSDDRSLAQLAGFGRAVAAWMDVRAAVLAEFVECSDGRLYHRLDAGAALKAWGGRLWQRWNTECARIRKHNQRHGTQVPFPPLPEGAKPFGKLVPEDKAPLSHGTKAVRHTGNAVQSREDRGESKTLSSASAREASEIAAVDDAVARIWAALPQVPRDRSSRDQVKSSVIQVQACGVEPSALACAVERFCRESPTVRDEQGKYLGTAHRWLLGETWREYLGKTARSVPTPNPADVFPDDVRDVVWHSFFNKADSYLSQCSWHKGPDRALITSNRYVFGKLDSECASRLRRIGVRLILSTGSTPSVVTNNQSADSALAPPAANLRANGEAA